MKPRKTKKKIQQYKYGPQITLITDDGPRLVCKDALDFQTVKTRITEYNNCPNKNDYLLQMVNVYYVGYC